MAIMLLRWYLDDREVELLYSGRGRGRFSVTRLVGGGSENTQEGTFDGLDDLKDIVGRYVLGRPAGSYQLRA